MAVPPKLQKAHRKFLQAHFCWRFLLFLCNMKLQCLSELSLPGNIVLHPEKELQAQARHGNVFPQRVSNKSPFENQSVKVSAGTWEAKAQGS